MDTIYLSFALALFGLVLGSFSAATVWRLRARQLVEDKAVGESVDKTEYRQLLPLTQTTHRTDRSRCLHCGHTLAWYDLLPLVSWAQLRGRCRYCQQPIGWFEPLMELGMAALFVVSYLAWPQALMTTQQWMVFIGWLIAAVILLILFAYDLKWFLLPDRLVFSLMGVGVLMTIVRLTTTEAVVPALASIVGALCILSGLYLVLWLVSRGQWIGFGDVKLGAGLALILADWRLAFVALFAANLIGCLIVVPGMIRGTLSRTTRVPFGPLLIAGCIIALLWGGRLASWYAGLMMA